jgi:hypothetical protein
MKSLKLRSGCLLVLILLIRLCPADEPLKLSWTNNLLKVTSPELPGGALEIWYLEAFCRANSRTQNWNKTTVPHKTVLLESSSNRQILKFRTTVQTNVEVLHTLRSSVDEIDITYEFKNHGADLSPIEWFQPACIRLAKFSGRDQTNYTARSFIFTERGLTTLDQTHRTLEALYKGGQVYVPKNINRADANPRPLADDYPINGLIGCFSADDKYILATAFDQTHELFEGVYVCLHSDPHIGGLASGETKRIYGKIYLLPNDVEGLLKRYRADFQNRESK